MRYGQVNLLRQQAQSCMQTKEEEEESYHEQCLLKKQKSYDLL
jgi:hypothetical protein